MLSEKTQTLLVLPFNGQEHILFTSTTCLGVHLMLHPMMPLYTHRDIQALAREAYFYQLSELLHHIQHTALVPQPSTRSFFDMLYLETGFKSIEHPAAIKEMEHAKTVMMQQLNHIVHVRSQDGFTVEEILPGVAHRQDEVGNNTEHNLYYNVLLKKVVPLLPQDMTAEGDDVDDDDGDNDGDDDQQHQQRQQQGEGAEDNNVGGGGGGGGGGGERAHQQQRQGGSNRSGVAASADG